MRIIVAGLLAASLVTANAFAADAPLPAGKAAGTKTAQEADNTVFFVLGAGLIAVGAIALSSGDSNSTLTPGTVPSTGT